MALLTQYKALTFFTLSLNLSLHLGRLEARVFIYRCGARAREVCLQLGDGLYLDNWLCPHQALDQSKSLCALPDLFDTAFLAGMAAKESAAAAVAAII